MPSRSASSAESSGCSLTIAVSRPARTTSPVRVSTRSEPSAGEGAISAGTATSGSSESTCTIRVAATRARMTLLAYSVAVRSGIIRKAE